MASEHKKKRFREPETVETNIENVKEAIPRSTLYKNRWGVRIFEAWQAECENKLVMSEENPFVLDLAEVENLDTSLRNMSMKSMNFWLIKFVQELADKDGDPYPEKTIYYRLTRNTSGVKSIRLKACLIVIWYQAVINSALSALIIATIMVVLCYVEFESCI